MPANGAILPRPPLAARLSAVASLALGAWLLYALVRDAIRAFTSPDVSARDEPAIRVLGFIVGCGIVGYFVWLARRLLRPLSAATVRWAVGTAAVVWVASVASLVNPWLESAEVGWAGSVITLALVVGLGVAYRRMTRAIIARAQLHDPVVLHGEPVGRAARVKIFCFVLGWAIFLASSEMMTALILRRPRMDRFTPWVFVPMVLGYVSYRLVLWRLTPPERTALPPGGFEVVQEQERLRE